MTSTVRSETKTNKSSKRTHPKAKQDSSATKTAIMDAALVEFSEFGFKGASVRSIGKRAQVDFTLITYYFGTKEKLWREVALRGVTHYLETVDQLIPPEINLTAGQKLRLKLQAELEFACSKNSLFNFTINEFRSTGPRLDWLYENFINVVKGDTLELIEQAQANKEIISADPQILHKLMQTSLRSLLISDKEFQHLTGQNPRSPEVRKKLWDLFDCIFFSNVPKG